MSQLASQVRTLISERKTLRDSVGVCDDFEPAQSKGITIKEHLRHATHETKPLLGNPAHKTLLFDECEQLIIPFCFDKQSSVAVVTFVVNEHKRQADIQYFDAKGADLADEFLVSLVAFFTENNYEVNYECVSEKIQKKGIDSSKITAYKAIDLVNSHVKLSENLAAALLAGSDEEGEAKTQSQEKVTQQPSAKGYPWRVGLLAAMLVATAVYSGWNYLQPYLSFLIPYASFFSNYVQSQALGIAALLPANPILAIMACAAVFYAGWLLVSALRYLSRPRENEPPLPNPTTNPLRADPTEQSQNKTLLHSYNTQMKVPLNDSANESLAETKKKRPQA